MTPEQKILARQLVSHPNWEWRPGAIALGRKNSPGAWFRVEETLSRLHGDWAEAIPDLTDEGTLGTLLGQLGAPRSLPCSWVVQWHLGKEDLGTILARALLAQWGEARPQKGQSPLECDSCGSFPERAGLLSPSSLEGDRCPASTLDDWDCDGKLVSKSGEE